MTAWLDLWFPQFTAVFVATKTGVSGTTPFTLTAIPVLDAVTGVDVAYDDTALAFTLGMTAL
jgi:hypothetical protein